MQGFFQQRLWGSLLPFLLGLSLLLGGCVRYDVGVHFAEQHRGDIVQHIRLGEQLTTLSQAEADRWLASLETRARALQGKAKRLSPQELEITIPFGNGQELVSKFNQFFNPPASGNRAKPKAEQLDLLQLKAEMALDQQNWLLFDRNHLTLSVDLRALGVLSQQGNIILSPGSLIDLSFGLQTPLWLTIPENPEVLGAEPEAGLGQRHWQLKPGQINTIEAVFWVPSYLALGSLLVIVLCFGGFYLKYRRWPGVLPAVGSDPQP
ncbi:DUF3153 domain-containing protein [Synechocystis sp. LKSZ1]|uniref:DUF3153 domain-containing protein n=1 Tax=Synechocystis sp. LKSZ1 TaxID=3144951 RepID=UPI00336BDB70